MKELSVMQMEEIKGGRPIDCAFVVAEGFCIWAAPEVGWFWFGTAVAALGRCMNDL